MTTVRPYPWEKSYPAGVRWDAPIETSSISALLDKTVAAHGEKPVFDYRERKILYRELGAMADRFAAALIKMGLGKGGRIALYLPNTPFHPIAFFGAMRAGTTIVHLSALDAERMLVHKLTDSGTRTLVTANFPGILPMAQKLLAAGHVDRLIVGDEAFWGPPPFPAETFTESGSVIAFTRLLENQTLPREWPAVTADDTALMQYTGGTTGLPKAAMLTHGNLTAATAMYHAWYVPQTQSEPGSDRVICVLPLFHIYALSSVMLNQMGHASEFLLRTRFDVETTLRDIEVKRATLFPGVPTMWIALVSLPGIEKRDLSSLRQCGSGGAPLPVEIAERFERLTGMKLRNGWGMTETSPAGTGFALDGPNKPGSIGLPLPGIIMQAVAVDDPRRVLAPGEIGEFRIKGLNVFSGYWNRPEETAASFADGYFLTGDMGYMDEDGYLFLVDRKKDMIISGGFNVYPGAIEFAIYEHPDVEEVTVIGIPDDYRGEAAKAFVKMRNGATLLTLEALQAFLADKIGRHEMPRELELRDALPRTPVGKLSKKELVEEERAKRAESKVSEVANA
jgi:long-chain acyl-CoA synthetase